mmetsp:Transcript_11653/g.32904  ORF Transcript_11653/g.32904 Transcript_11653/m.32904 type:complete len:291 (+) Transcript_11653:1179-2051(+)
MQGTRVLPPTSTMSSMSGAWSLALFNTLLTVSKVRVKNGEQSFSNCARVTDKTPSSPPMISPTSTSTASLDERPRLAFSAARLALARTFSSAVWPFFFSSPSTQSVKHMSKSSPPKRVSPPVPLTSTMPPSIWSTDTSKVPPPKSKTSTCDAFFSPIFWSNPYPSAAAVGSLMIRKTSRPAMAPAACVALRCASLKYAGTVTTAFFTSRPRSFSAISFMWPSTMALTSSGAKRLGSRPSAVTTSISRPSSSRLMMSKGSRLISCSTAVSSARLPMIRFTSNSVRFGARAA